MTAIFIYCYLLLTVLIGHSVRRLMAVKDLPPIFTINCNNCVTSNTIVIEVFVGLSVCGYNCE